MNLGSITLIHGVSEKVGHFYFYDNFGKSVTIFSFFFTVDFRKDLMKKMKLKRSPPIKSVAALPCKNKCSTNQRYSIVNSVQMQMRLITV